MAQTQTPFVFLLFLIFLILFSIHSSLVYAIRQEKQQKQHFRPSPVLSLSLHPHDSIITKSKLKNYTALTISQLDADAARVKYINSRISHALSKFDPSIETEEIETTLTSTRGGYSARIGVGQPVKEFLLVADTGSDINWVSCSKCAECNQNSDPIFLPSLSSTYQPLSCASQQCNALRDDENQCSSSSSTCSYQILYGGGSTGSRGEFATEVLSFGSSGSVDNVAIGCGLETAGFSGFAGILGLGGGQVSLPSQIKGTSFSYCLVDPDSSSSSTLEFNSAPPSDSVIFPFLRNPSIDTFYYVELTGITVGEDPISIPPEVYQVAGKGGIIVDSGTTLTMLNSQVYIPFRDAFRKNSQGYLPASSGEFSTYDTCYDVPSDSASNVKGPPISFQFSGGKTLMLPGKNSLKRVAVSVDGRLTKFCLAFTSIDQGVSIIGNVVQTGMRVTYDLSNNLIGFSPNKC